MKTKICGICEDEYQTTARRSSYCGDECRRIAANIKQNAKKSEKNAIREDTIECKICGDKFQNLTGHLKKMHGVSSETYVEKYGGKVINEAIREKLSDNVKGEKNPGYQHGGKLSPWSDKSEYHDTDTIKSAREKAYTNYTKDKRDVCVEYWVKKGHSEKEAMVMIAERQRTFTLEKCIETHGEKKGREVHAERQRKWLSSMPKTNFSKVSQALFWAITEKRGTDGVFFAELTPDKEPDFSGKNNEITLKLSDSSCKPDYYCEYTNRIIEFDGDYWHGEVRGNIEREKRRDHNLKECGYYVYHVKERDYRANPEKIIKECLEFLDE